jgi:hypothetical protein
LPSALSPKLGEHVETESFEGWSFPLALSTMLTFCEQDVETTAERVPQQLTKEPIK